MDAEIGALDAELVKNPPAQAGHDAGTSHRKGPISMKSLKSYYRVMLGQKSVYAAECFAGNFIGTDFGIDQDLTKKLPEEWRAFNQEFIPIYLAKHPDKTKIGAGLACGALWTVSKGSQGATSYFVPMGRGTIVWAKSTVTYVRTWQDSFSSPPRSMAKRKY